MPCIPVLAWQLHCRHCPACLPLPLPRGGPDQGAVVGLKFLQRPPRGNGVREHHGLPNLKAVQFAEQARLPISLTASLCRHFAALRATVPSCSQRVCCCAAFAAVMPPPHPSRLIHPSCNAPTPLPPAQVQVTPLSLLLSTKDKKTAVRLRPGGLLNRTEEEAEEDEFRPTTSSCRSRGRRSSASSSARTGGGPAGAAASTAEAGGPQQQGEQQQQQQQPEEPVLAEPQTFYRLADGSWHFEMCRFYTAAQAEAATAAAGRSLVLPQGFDRSCELLRALEREHAPMSDIAGA